MKKPRFTEINSVAQNHGTRHTEARIAPLVCLVPSLTTVTFYNTAIPILKSVHAPILFIYLFFSFILWEWLGTQSTYP